MKKLIYILPLILFAVLIGFFIIGLERDPRLIPSPFIGKSAPEFSLPRLLNADQLITQAELKGEVMLVNFWATWCPTCKGEHDVLMEVARSNKELAIYGIDYKDKKEDALSWLKQLGNPYRAVAFDQEGVTGIDWGVYGTPETFILDEQGIIHYKHVGAISWQDWKQILEPIVLELQSGLQQ
ncbi:MAG: DsbE family thiol:disulfide interchange protein [Gammaproteobacteria bacterium]